MRHLPSSSSLYHNIDSSLDEGLFDGDVGGIDGELACGNQGGRVLGYDDVADVDDEGKSVVDELWSDDESVVASESDCVDVAEVAKQKVICIKLYY